MAGIFDMDMDWLQISVESKSKKKSKVVRVQKGLGDPNKILKRILREI